MKRIHYFQHVPFENLGAIESWARRCGHRISSTQFCDDPQPPDMDKSDWLIVMGGPMGVHDHQAYPRLPIQRDGLP